MADVALSGRAAKLAAQVTKAAGSALAPGESVLVAVRVNVQGLVAATAAGAVGGAAGVIAGSEVLPGGAAEAGAAGFPSDPQQALGLTERGIVVTSRSSLSGKPKDFRCTIPLAQIGSVAHEPGGLGDTLTIVMRSGASVTFQSVKVDPGEAFAGALRERLRAAPPAPAD